MLESLMIKKLFDKGVFTLFSSVALEKEKSNMLKIANHMFMSGEDYIKILHDGETSCLALFRLLGEGKKAIVVDERTTRILCEAPENLHQILESKLHMKITAQEKNYPSFKDFKVIRSSELILLAYKLGIIDLPAKKHDAIEALLYGLKFKGCTISGREIESAMGLV